MLLVPGREFEAAQGNIGARPSRRAQAVFRSRKFSGTDRTTIRQRSASASLSKVKLLNHTPAT